MLIHDDCGHLIPKAYIIKTQSYIVENGKVVRDNVDGYAIAARFAENLDINEKFYIEADAAVKALESRGYTVRFVHDFRGDYWEGVHEETQRYIEEAERKRLEAEKEWEGAEKGFLRFGKPPKGGRSYNTRDRLWEKGVSCYPAEFLQDGRWRIFLTDGQECQSMIYSAGGKPYRLYGEQLGVGSDGEPVIKLERYEEAKRA